MLVENNNAWGDEFDNIIVFVDLKVNKWLTNFMVDSVGGKSR